MQDLASDSSNETQAIQRLESYVYCARAELASDPHNETLREFIRLNEALARKERARLVRTEN